MQNTDTKTVELIINSQSAKQKLDELHQKIEKVNDKKTD